MNANDHQAMLARAEVRRPDLTVADVMRTDFRAANATATAAEVATALHLSRCPVLPITQAQVPLGIVTEHALTAALAERGADFSRLTAADIMDARYPTIHMKTPIEEAACRLIEAGGFLLAVNSDRQLKGVVTLVEIGPQLTEVSLGRLVASWTGTSNLAGIPGLPDLKTPAEAARAVDPSAEIKPTKSQAQPHPWDSPTGEHPGPVPLLTPSDTVNPMLKVGDVMTADPRTCAPASSALEAVMIFRDADCGVIPVTEDGQPLGVVTDRDIALALADHETDLAALPVEQLMSRDVVTIRADSSLDAAIATLEEHGLRRLLVVDDDGRLAGVLSGIDLVPHLSDRGLGQAVRRVVAHRE
jgi:CBS domain-containing protein